MGDREFGFDEEKFFSAQADGNQVRKTFVVKSQEDLSSSDDDVSWASLGNKGGAQASMSRGLGSDQEEYNFYLETASLLQEHLQEVDVDAARYGASCRKK
eukprot:2434762-Amphidinium_carterae.1